MSNPSPDLSNVLAVLHRDREPLILPQETQARVLARISASTIALGTSPQGAPNGSRAWSHFAFTVGTLTGVAGTLIVGALLRSPSRTTEPRSTNTYGLESTPAKRSETSTAIGAEKLVQPPSAHSVQTGSPRGSQPDTSPSRHPETEVRTAPPIDPNGSERLLVQAVLNDLRAGDPDHAEALLLDARTQFVNGRFAEERMWLWVRCASARSDQAETINRAEDYLEQYPDGIHQHQARALIPGWRLAQ